MAVDLPPKLIESSVLEQEKWDLHRKMGSPLLLTREMMNENRMVRKLMKVEHWPFKARESGEKPKQRLGNLKFQKSTEVGLIGMFA